MTTLPLTERQMICLRVIQDLTDAMGGLSPTLDQIGSRIGNVKSNVHRLIGQLVEAGYVQRFPNRDRGLRLLHRLPPTPNEDLAALLNALSACPPSRNGVVYVQIPKVLIDRAIAATRTAPGAVKPRPSGANQGGKHVG